MIPYSYLNYGRKNDTKQSQHKYSYHQNPNNHNCLHIKRHNSHLPHLLIKNIFESKHVEKNGLSSVGALMSIGKFLTRDSSPSFETKALKIGSRETLAE